MLTAFLNFIGGIKGVAIIAIIIAIGGWAFVQKRNVEKANLERDQAIVQRDQAAVERDKAIGVARENEQTINRLNAEKENINQALNSLQTAITNISAATNRREIVIQQQGSLPANQVATPPVITQIISDIQADRAARRGQAQTSFIPQPAPAASEKRIRE